MSRNYGIMGGRASLRGQLSTDTSAYSANSTRADSENSFACALPPDALVNSLDFGRGLSIPPFKRSNLAQALIDVCAFVFGFFFFCALAGSVPLAIFILLFIR